MFLKFTPKSRGMGDRYNTIDKTEPIRVVKGQVFSVSDETGGRILEDFKQDFEKVVDADAAKVLGEVEAAARKETEAEAKALKEAQDRMAKAREAKQEKKRNEKRGGK